MLVVKFQLLIYSNGTAVMLLWLTFESSPGCCRLHAFQVLELWGEGASVEEAADAVKNFPEEIKQPYYDKEVTWSIAVGLCCV